MKKIFKTILLLAAMTTGMGTLVSCGDDDELTKADALFRPIINETDNIEQGLDDNLIPYVVIKWDDYTDANQYTIKLEAIDGSDTKELTTSELTCRFDGLEYDKEYFVYITSANTETGLSSKPYSLTITTNDYPTHLTTPAVTDIIDTQVRIKWNGSYSSLKLVTDENEEVVADTTLTDAINEAQEIIFRGLEPRTSYRVIAYENGQYRGKKRFTTVAAESYEGVVFDLRGREDGAGYINTDQLATDVAENPGQDITYVLEGGTKYKISGGTAIPGTANTIKFVTGLTLAGNAIFRSTGGMTGTAGEDIHAIEYEKIDFISDKADGGGYEVENNHDKGWGGRQVFNINNYKATIGSISFKRCSMTGYRAVVRGQQNGDNINNVILEDCIVNAIGDQGVFTTTNKDQDWQSITMKNCTVTNIIMLCDLRKTTNKLTFNIENCTFCYAPIETTANANTPMFRLGDKNVVLNVKNTLFGPTMATDNSEGGSINPNVAGVAGSIFVSGTPDNTDIADSYKTNFAWTDLGADEPKIYPLEGLGELGLSEKALWSNPAAGIFSIAGKASGVDLSKLGDSRWQ